MAIRFYVLADGRPFADGTLAMRVGPEGARRLKADGLGRVCMERVYTKPNIEKGVWKQISVAKVEALYGGKIPVPKG